MSAGRLAAVGPRILVFDSGLGGLTVLREVTRMRPDADYVYLADDAVFPYGALSEADVVARVCGLMQQYIRQHVPHLVVIACNTASTLVLPPLRAMFPVPFVGTVPAIKPAAASTRSKMFSVLATPGTVARDYTQALIDEHAGDCKVTLVGSPKLATLAERVLLGGMVDDAEILSEIEPAFVATPFARTDTVVLACTHYPLLLETLKRVAPWEVEWIDPAPAIARRVGQLLPSTQEPNTKAQGDSRAIFTSDTRMSESLAKILNDYGLYDVMERQPTRR